MKKIIVLVVMFIVFVAATFKQVKKYFPKVNCISLEEKKVVFPDIAKGKYAITFVAPDSNGVDSLMTWVEPVYREILHPEQTDFKQTTTEMNTPVYFIMTESAASQRVSEQIIDSIRKHHELDLMSDFLFVQDSLHVLKTGLGITKQGTVQMNLIDYNGRVIYTYEGTYSAKELSRVRSIIGG